MKEYDDDLWMNDIAPTGKIWKKANKGLKSGCTSKGKKCGTGGKTVKLI